MPKALARARPGALWRLADDASELDLRPLLACISTLNDVHASAALWHANLAAALAHWRTPPASARRAPSCWPAASA